jgi:hypothetical protein
MMRLRGEHGDDAFSPVLTVAPNPVDDVPRYSNIEQTIACYHEQSFCELSRRQDGRRRDDYQQGRRGREHLRTDTRLHRGFGSLSGDGSVSLGAKTLTLGGLNRNDTIGCIIRGWRRRHRGKSRQDRHRQAHAHRYQYLYWRDDGERRHVVGERLDGVVAADGGECGGALGGNGTVGNTLINGGPLARATRSAC